MKAVSNWIFLAGGIIVGLIVFSIFISILLYIKNSSIEQKSYERFLQIKDIINNLCWSHPGNKREYSITIGNTVKGIYLSRDKYTTYRDDELVNYIMNKRISEGNFICINIKDKRLRCEILECNASMPFIGSLPKQFSLSTLISLLTGNVETTSFDLRFERENELKVKIEVV